MKLPSAYEGMESGTIRRWLKPEGSVIAKGDLIAVVESEEAMIEIESPTSGKLARILVSEGKTALVGARICVIGEGGLGMESTAKTAEREHSVIPILMPQVGQSMEEGTIVKWHVRPGDRIQVGQVIFEVETDKAVVEVEADGAGRVSRIVVPENETVPVKAPVAYLAENDADVDAHMDLKVMEEVESEEAIGAIAPPQVPDRSTMPIPAVTETGRVKASPAARKQAAELGIDLLEVPLGSGPGGRILLSDVLGAKVAPGGPTRRSISEMRKAIARNVTVSKQTIPHFYMKISIDAEPLLAFCRTQKQHFPCGVNDAIVLACAKTIREFPAFRSRIEGDNVVEYPTANIGIAVGMEDGLVVPVLVGADRMSLEEAAGEIRRIVKAALAGKVENMGQGVFTVSNLGMYRVEEFSAIINPPEAAILAVGAARDEAVVSNGVVRPGKTMTMILSCDHRIIDGLLAAKFSARLKQILESPDKYI